MKMVASAKLRKVQSKMENFLPYQYKLTEILQSFLTSTLDFESVFAEEREVKRMAIVVFSSNSSLCGAFNSNMVKLLKETVDRYKCLGYGNIEIYPIGKKIEEQVRKLSFLCPVMGSYIELMEHPHFEGAKQVSEVLIQHFLNHQIDRVELLYNHAKSIAVQIPTAEQYLPVVLKAERPIFDSPFQLDYIIEPDQATVLQSLLPKTLHSKIYATLLDSAVAEQGARVVAMQIATDNAGEILDELTIQYNKQRQQAITSELLDIISGSEALK